MERSRAYKIHQNKRVINKRKKMAKTLYHCYRHEGTLRKYNLVCSCGMCDVNHPQKQRRRDPSVKEKNLLKVFKEEL